MICLLVFLMLAVLFMGSCNVCDVILCLYCGCVTPETCFELCDCSCNLTCGACGDLAEGCGDLMGACPSAGCFPTIGCEGCLSGEDGEPLDCEDVGCPACQRYFECDDCFVPEEPSGGSDDGGYATDEEFYDWLDKNGY